jgi:hypothetical protein
VPANVDLVNPNLAVQPGEAVSTTIRLTNTGRIVDELTLEVIGDAAAYATVQPAQVALFPGAQGEATVSFRPPRGPMPGAGVVPFGVRVRSQEDRSFSFVVEGRLQIGVLMAVAARLSPRNSIASRLGQSARHRVELDNNSNTVARIRIAAGDPDEQLRFAIPEPVITIPPGGRAVTHLRVSARDRMVTGAAVTRPFQVVAVPDGSVPITLDGSFVQRPTIAVGASQILALAAVVGVAALLATQVLPQVLPQASPSPAPATSLTAVGSAAGASAQASVAPASAATGSQGSTAAASIAPPTAIPPPSTSTAAASTAPPSAASVAPTTAPPPPSSAPPMAVRIVNLGLVDPLAAPMTATPEPQPTETPQPSAGATFRPPIRVFPSFPHFVLQSPSALAPVGGPGNAAAGPGGRPAAPLAAARLPAAQEAASGPPVQQFGLEVEGPVAARITRVSDGTAPTLCLTRAGNDQQCLADTNAVTGDPGGTDAQAWFLSVVAQQGGTSVDVSVEYPPQPVTFGFKDLHLAGVSAGSGVHLVIQASQAGLIEIVSQVNVGADVTVTIRDLNSGLAPPPSTQPAGISGAPYIAAAEAGHFYDILLTSSSPDEVFVSGTISWP